MFHADLATVRHYHRLSKHLPERYAPGPGQLDWATQPDPFRRFAGCRLIPLPFARHGGARYQQLYQPTTPPAMLDRATLGALLELGLGLSAWKEWEGNRWSLRNHPSSGNLHPTEGYVVLLQPIDTELVPGVYHYAPCEHALECRATLGPDGQAALWGLFPHTPALLGLSSIHWREAWKYGERAFRYCQLDTGHAAAALAFAGRVAGWPVHLVAGASDNAIAALCGLDRERDFHMAEQEHPDLLLALTPDCHHLPARCDVTQVRKALGDAAWHGQANPLSTSHVSWHALEQVVDSTSGAQGWPVAHSTASCQASPSVGTNDPDAVMAIRLRRSAAGMDGSSPMSQAAFRQLLARLMPSPAAPWIALPFDPAISLLLFVHHVEGMSPGLYLLPRAAGHAEALRQAMDSPHLHWHPVSDAPLSLICLSQDTDWRDAARMLNCQQDIAADGAFAVAMLADFDHALQQGAPNYRRLFWECGLLGQILHLEAEAAGLAGTGIGCFYDDLLHRIIGLDVDAEQWQSLYHFTIGGREEDRRLRTIPAYAHLDREQEASS